MPSRKHRLEHFRSQLGGAHPAAPDNKIKNVIALFVTRGILASILFLVGGAGIGWLYAVQVFGSKGVFALGTVPTQIATALLIGGKSFDDPLVLVLIVAVAVVGLLILMTLARV